MTGASVSIPAIDIRPDHWQIVRHILRLRVPQHAVWAFGSRAKWTAKPHSDLDLAVITDKPLPLSVSAALADDFSESNLPWKVDVVDWAATSDSFRKVIEREKVVVLNASDLSDWRETTLGDICCQQGGSIQTGPFGSQLHASDYTVIGTPVVMPVNLIDGRVEEKDIARVPDEFVEKLARHKLAAGDIVFSRRGDVTRFALVSGREAGWLCGTGCLKVSVGKPSVAIPEFVAISLALRESKEWLIRHAVGATMPNLNTEILGSVPITLPPLEEQHAIADTLGALDDRIDNLRQTNVTLEAIAAALFKSRFVDFDGVPPEDMQESELGMIPKGWRAGTLADLCELKYGKALKATERRDGQIPVYGSGGITGYHDEALVTKPTIVVGRKGTVGALYWQSAPCFPIDTVFYVEPKVSLNFCYYAMMRMKLHNLNTDAAVPGLNRDNAYRQSVVIPGAEKLAKWDAIASDLRARMDNAVQQAVTLAALRDTLLPRLISGQLRVKDLKNTPENQLDTRSDA